MKLSLINRFGPMNRNLFYKNYDGACQKEFRHKLLSGSAANELVTRALLAGKPFFAGRMGGTETKMCWNISRAPFLKPTLTEGDLRQALLWSGISNRGDGSLDRFAAIYLAALSFPDLIGFWGIPGMATLISRYGSPSLQVTVLEALDPLNTSRLEPWSLALKGKRVLVVHPFAQSIQSQYKRRSSIKTISAILPAFEIETLIPPVTFAGQDNNKTWVENLQFLMENTAKRTFDVAIIGCGAYGLPLGAFVKQLGRQAIHLGGATQLLFGIRGKRWDDREDYAQMMDDTWVRPIEEERPAGADKVEDACYW